METAVNYQVHVHVLEKVSIDAASITEMYTMTKEILTNNQPEINQSFCPPGSGKNDHRRISEEDYRVNGDAYVSLHRIMPLDETSKIKLKWMPGFRISWQYVELENRTKLNITPDKVLMNEGHEVDMGRGYDVSQFNGPFVGFVR